MDNLKLYMITYNVGTTAPSGPSAGNLWWNTNEGTLYIYYTDVDSSQWVETSPSGGQVDYYSLASNVAFVLTGNANTETATVSYVVDTFTGDGSQTVFTMSVAESVETQIIVFVGSIYQDPATAYTVDGGFDITFTSAPPNSVPINVIHTAN